MISFHMFCYNFNLLHMIPSLFLCCTFGVLTKQKEAKPQ